MPTTAAAAPARASASRSAAEPTPPDAITGWWRVAGASRHPVIAAGGIGSEADLVTLARAGAHAAVVGMALYTGRLAPLKTNGGSQSWP